MDEEYYKFLITYYGEIFCIMYDTPASRGEFMKTTKMFFIVIIFAAVTIMINGCSLDFLMDENDRYEESVRIVNSKNEEGSKLSQKNTKKNYVVTDTSETKEYSMKNTLNEEQTEIYNRLVYDIEAYKTEFEFENISDNDLKAAYYAVLDDHPEYFWMGKSFSYSVSTFEDYSAITASPNCMSKDPDKIKALQSGVSNIVDQIVENASAKSDPYEKLLYVHDYIIDHTTYDSETLYLINANQNEGLLNASTVYGCLVEHKAICSGYSATFQLILNRLGIDCYRVSGTRVSEQGPHQWNFLKLDDEYYYTDVTWDDPVKENNEPSKTYEYFLISDDDLFRTHTLDNERPVPECKGTRYNYYVYNGLYFEEYDFRYIEDIAEIEPERGVISVKFSTKEQRDIAINDLITNMNIFSIPYVNGGVSYTQSASGLILTIKYMV